MRYQKLGSTGMMVSEIGFGGIPILRVSEKQAIKVLRRAFEKGINFVDTFRKYGDSEIKIGKALVDVRHRYYLATKISDHARSDAQKSLNESLKRLKTDYIDLLFIKNLDSEQVLKQALGRNGSLRVAREAQKAGIVRHIGFTSHTEKIAYQALHTGEFEVVMYPYSMLNISAEKRIFKYCQKHNVGFVCMKSLAGGFLTIPQEIYDKMKKNKPNTTAAGAIAFCLAHPAVTTVIPGIAQIKHLNLALQGLKKSMTEKQYRDIIARIGKFEEEVCRNCSYCKPCPRGVDINNIFRFYQYYKYCGLKDYAQQKYTKLRVNALKCERCGICLPRCPYRIDIPQRLTIAHKILTK